jgi:hypothetical protein
MAQTADGFFSVKDVPSALGISDETLYRRIKVGTVEALRIGDRIFLLKQHVIDAVERGLGSKTPDKVDQTIARAEQREQAELNRGNGPVKRGRNAALLIH